MLLVTSLHKLPPIQSSGLTIGSFDGVHLGHQALIRHLRSQIGQDATLVVFTFSNHPSEVFNSPVPLIYPPLQKVRYLKECGADLVILIPFTQEFSQTLFDHFLTQLKNQLHFSHLTLGMGATFGKKKEGNPENVTPLADKLKFVVTYFPKVQIDHTTISSGRIRQLIGACDFNGVQAMLGRPYSIMGCVEKGVMQVRNLCLPSANKYTVRIRLDQKIYPAEVKIDSTASIIEIEFLDKSLNKKKLAVEIFFS